MLLLFEVTPLTTVGAASDKSHLDASPKGAMEPFAHVGKTFNPKPNFPIKTVTTTIAVRIIILSIFSSCFLFT